MPTGRILKVTRQGAAEPGAKSDVYDCLVYTVMDLWTLRLSEFINKEPTTTTTTTTTTRIPPNGVARIWCKAGAENNMTLLSHTTRNNTQNKVHVTGSELPQLLSQNTNMFGEATT